MAAGRRRPVPSLSPRDIQARIRSGESAEDVARIAGVPVDRVLRYAGPVLQERAMLAQHARRTRLKDAEKRAPLAEVVDGRLAQHGIDTEKISWDAYRRDDGTWRIVATWPSGKATAQAIWDLDKARQWSRRTTTWRSTSAPSGPRRSSARSRRRSGRARLPGPSRGEPSRGGHGLPARPTRRRPAATRSGPAATRCSPRSTVRSARAGRGLEPRTPAALAGPDAPGAAGRRRCRGAARRRPGLGVRRRLGPAQGGAGRAVAGGAPAPPHGRRGGAGGESTDADGKPRKRLPSWDDVLFGSGPAARESS